MGVDASPMLQYTLSYDGQTLIAPSKLAVALDGQVGDFVREVRNITVSAAKHTLTVHLAPGGGFISGASRCGR